MTNRKKICRISIINPGLLAWYSCLSPSTKELNGQSAHLQLNDPSSNPLKSTVLETKNKLGMEILVGSSNTSQF